MRNWKRRIGSMVFLFMLCGGLAACRSSSDAEDSKTAASDISTTDTGEQSAEEPEGKAVLQINVDQSYEWLETAVQMFQKKNPDITIEVQVFNGKAGDEEWNEADAQKEYAIWLDGQLLSGDAGDIVLTSAGLHVEKYEDTGLLEDMTPYLESAEEIREDGFYMNIFDAFRSESGALYELPIAGMASPLFTFNRTVAEETGVLAVLEAAEKKSMTWEEALALGEEMFQTSTHPRRALLVEQSFLFNIFRQEVAASVDYANAQVQLREKELYDVLAAYEKIDYYNSISDREQPSWAFGLVNVEDTTVANSNLRGYELNFQWERSDGKIYIFPHTLVNFAITGQSEQKTLAWEFLKFLLSDEVQTLPEFPYASINKNGLRARVSAYCEEYEVPEENIEEMVNLLDEWLTQIDAYVPEDLSLLIMTYSVWEEFANGNLTTEEVIQEVELRLEQYLSELEGVIN